MIDKKLNVIRDKAYRKAASMDELVLTKDESIYLLRLLDLNQAKLDTVAPRENYDVNVGGLKAV